MKCSEWFLVEQDGYAKSSYIDGVSISFIYGVGVKTKGEVVGLVTHIFFRYHHNLVDFTALEIQRITVHRSVKFCSGPDI